MADSPPTDRWIFRLLGPVAGSLGACPLPDLPTQKATAMLAYLALHCGKAVPRRLLIELFWRGSAPETGANSLSAALSALRRAFRSVDPDRPPPLLANRLRIELDPACCTTDVAEFLAALDAARGAPQVAQIAHLRRAITAYGRGLLPELKYDWQPPERRLLRQRYLIAADELLDILEGQGQFGEALQQAEAVLVNEPERELTHRRVMRLLARHGEWRRANQHFEQLAAALASQGSEPTPETCRLAAAIRHGEWQPVGEGEAAGQRAYVPAGLVVCVTCEAAVRGLLASRPGAMEPAGVDAGQPVVFARLGEALRAIRHCLVDTEIEPRPSFAVTAGEAALNASTWVCAAAGRSRALLPAAPPGQILCDEAAAALARAEARGLVQSLALGEHVLTRPGQLLRLSLLVFPELGEPTWPPLKPAARPADGLAAPAGPLFGREPFLHKVAALLAQSDRRMVTVVGPPGCGKSRVAVEAARRLVQPFGGRVWAVSLAATPSPAGIMPRLLAALRLDAGSSEPLLTLRQALGSTAPALLLLDDVEHLLPGARQVFETLLAGLPGIKLLVTSREACRLADEELLRLPPLPLPSEAEPLTAQRQDPAVALFCDALRQADPGFCLTDLNHAEVVVVCRRLDGLPLALEHAAAAAAELGVEHLAARLREGRGLSEAAGGGRALQQAFDRSYALLTPQQQAAYRALAVFHGGFDAAAFEAVAGSPLLAALPALVEKSLLAPAVVGPFERYEPLQTILDDAAQRLRQAGDQDALRTRHAQHYARVSTPRGRVHADSYEHQLARLNLPNYVAALWHAAEQGLGPELLALSTGHTAYLMRYDLDHGTVLQEPLMRALELARKRPGEAWIPGVVTHLMSVCRWGGDHQTSCAVAEEATALARAAGADYAEIYCAGSGMVSALTLHRHEEAARWAAYLHGLRGRTSRPGGLLQFLAQYEEANGRFADALAMVHEASHQRDTLRDTIQQQTLFERYAVIYAELGAASEAAEVAHFALRAALQGYPGDRWLQCLVRISAIVPLCWDQHREGARHHARQVAGMLQGSAAGLCGFFGIRLLEQCLIADEPELALELGQRLLTGWAPVQLRSDTRLLATRVAAETYARNHFHREAADALRTYAAENLDWDREPVAAAEALRIAAILLHACAQYPEALEALQTAVGLLERWPRRRQACRKLLGEIAHHAGLPFPNRNEKGAEAALAAALGALTQ